MSLFESEHFDYVITVCDDAAEQCPVFPGDPQRIHWSFPDPAAVQGTDLEKLAAFETTVREMKTRLSTFIPAATRARV
jgi:protein-tyrosine-phosphatase